MQHALGGAHKERRGAENDDAPQDTPVGFHVCRANAKCRFFAQQKCEYPYKGRELAYYCGKCRTRDAHVHREDEEWVEHHVQYRAEHGGYHGDFRKTLGGNVVVHTDRYLHKDGAHDVDRKVAVGVGEGLIARTENAQDRCLCRQRCDCDEHRRNEQHTKAVSKEFLCGGVVLPAHVDGGVRRTASAEQSGEGSDHRDDGCADTNGCHGYLAVLHLTDICTILLSRACYARRCR